MIRNIIFCITILGLLSCNQKPEKFTRLEQLSDQPLAVITGTAADVVAREKFPDAVKQNFYSTTDAAYNVKTGKSAAFLFDRAVLRNIVKKYPKLTLIEEPVDTAEIAIAFNKSRLVLMEKVNTVLEKFKDDGTIQKMKAKWISPVYQKIPRLPEINPNAKVFSTSAFSGLQVIQDSAMSHSTKDREFLKIGVCAEYPPMMYVYNTQITGFDMELAIRIANMLGKEIKIIDMSFDSLILSLQAEKIDFAISKFEITNERKNFVNFSEPYLKTPLSALVKK